MVEDQQFVQRPGPEAKSNVTHTNKSVPTGRSTQTASKSAMTFATPDVRNRRVQKGGHTLKCYYCDKPHTVRNCLSFMALSVSERQKWVNDKQACAWCLSMDHSIRNCKRTTRCGRRYFYDSRMHRAKC